MAEHILHGIAHIVAHEAMEELASTTSPPFDASLLTGEDLVVIEDHTGAIKRIWRVWKVAGANQVSLEGLMYFSARSPHTAAVMEYVKSKPHACWNFKYDLFGSGSGDEGFKNAIKSQAGEKRYEGPKIEKIRGLLGCLLSHTYDSVLKMVFLIPAGYDARVWKGGNDWAANTFWNRVKASTQKHPYKYDSVGRIWVTSANGALVKAVELCRF